jgi:hypothetical protein
MDSLCKKPQIPYLVKYSRLVGGYQEQRFAGFKPLLNQRFRARQAMLTSKLKIISQNSIPNVLPSSGDSEGDEENEEDEEDEEKA